MDSLPFFFMGAAGWAKTIKHVEELAKIPLTTHIVAGSFTMRHREGNTGGTNFDMLPDGTATNALGLPNGGLTYLMSCGPEMARIAHDAGKKFVVSGAWFSPEEAGQLAEIAFEIGADIFEDNRGCPNIFDGGVQKTIPSYNLDLMNLADDSIEHAVGNNPLWIKLSPCADPEERICIAEYLATTTAYGIVATNTLANVRLRNSHGNPLITAKDTHGLGGLSGTALKWLAHTNAEHYAELLPDLDIIGVGGIRSGEDVHDYMRVGCKGVQVGTASFWRDNVGALQEIGKDWAFEHMPDYDLA